MRTDRIYATLNGGTLLFISDKYGNITLDSKYPTYLLAMHMVKSLLMLETRLVYIKSGLALYSFKHEFINNDYAIVRTIEYLSKGQKKVQIGSSLLSFIS